MERSGPSRRPTVHDVARHAGVSPKTVSRVANGESGVSAELTGRVRSAIQVLGYRVDDRARRLRSGGTASGAIGFVLVDVANPFFSSLLRGIEEVACAEGYLVLSGSSDGRASREDQLIDAFVARRVEGMIVVPSGPAPGRIAEEIDRGTPTVFVDLELDDLSVDCIRSDHHGGARLATEHLLSYGHREITFFGDDAAIFSSRLRMEGFRRALADAGVAIRPERIVTGLHTPEGWETVIAAHLARPDAPTAIVTAQNFVSLGGLRARHGLGVAETVAQIGFDDLDLADLVRPGLSVVPQDPRDLGRRAAETLFRRMAGDRSPVATEIVSSGVIARGSGEIVALNARRDAVG
jgi:LacI family transcriptional regulator